jgi:GMP synthase-like glutamine amidotransferase
MKKILIIDNNIDRDCWGSTDLVRMIQNGSSQSRSLFVRRAPERDLPRDIKSWDGVIVSGSKTGATDQAVWIDELLEFIRYCVDLKTPYLGVCFGHQMLNRALYGLQCVRKAKAPEFGWSKIEVTEPNSLFTGLPQSFYSYSSHYDEVHHLDHDMRLLARSSLCSIQACQLKELPIFGIQFHPEKTLEGCEIDLKHRLKTKSPPNLLKPRESKALFQPEVGRCIFNNFLSLIEKGSNP